MSNGKGILGFVAGTLFGVAAGMVAGILVAPRSGTETRTMAAEAATDAWGNVVDAYHQGASDVATRTAAACEEAVATSDELREKVASARARMEEIRVSLANAAAAAEERVEVEAADPVVEPVADDAAAAVAAEPAE